MTAAYTVALDTANEQRKQGSSYPMTIAGVATAIGPISSIQCHRILLGLPGGGAG